TRTRSDMRIRVKSTKATSTRNALNSKAAPPPKKETALANAPSTIRYIPASSRVKELCRTECDGNTLTSKCPVRSSERPIKRQPTSSAPQFKASNETSTTGNNRN